MREPDTTAEAAAAQIAALRRLSPGERVRIALEMSQIAHDLALDGLRRWHPEWSLERARRELARQTWGAELARWIWPDEP